MVAMLFVTVKEIQNKWNSLRGCFRRDLLVQKQTPTTANAKRKRKYIYFDSLLFLLPFTAATNNELAEADNDDQSSETEKETEGIMEKRAKLREKDNNEEEMVVVNVPAKELNQYLKKEDHEDDDESFLRSLIPSFKQFTPDQKLMLRIEIMKAILNFKQSQSKWHRPCLTSSPPSQTSSYEDV
jgi:hypothetical protein